jgi:hypothetical protein
MQHLVYLTGEGHIPLAVSAIPTSAAPVMGVTSLCESTLDVEMYVTRVHEDPRVTKPFPKHNGKRFGKWVFMLISSSKKPMYV